MNDDDEFYMSIIEKRNRQRLIERGVRYDPIQTGELPVHKSEVVEAIRKKAGRSRKRRRR